MIPQPQPRLARVTWLLLVALILAGDLAGLVVRVQQMRQLCLEAEAVCHQTGQILRLTPADAVALRAAGLTVDAFVALEVAKWAIFSAIWISIGGLIFARKTDEWMALIVAFFLMTFPSGWDNIPAVLISAYPLAKLPIQVLQYLVSWGWLLFLALFPNGRLLPRWTRWLLVAAVLTSWIAFVPPEWQQNGWGALQLALSFLLIGGLALGQVIRYRRYSSPSERERTRWVLAGICGSVVLIGLLVGFWLISGLHFGPAEGPLDRYISEIFYQVSIALIPLSIGVAILRYRLFDIDVIIRRTLIYAALTGLLALAYFGSVVVLQNTFGALTGQRESTLVTVLSTLIIAALFGPLRGRVQTFIDQRFYRRKYDAARTLAAYSATLRDETNLDQLTAHLADVVDETMQPASVGLWLAQPSGTDRKAF